MPLADTQAIAVLTRRPPATIRYWAHRGWLTRKGTGPRGRALYATEDAEALMTRLLVDNAPDLRQHLECSGRAMPLPRTAPMRTSRHGWTRKPQPEHIIRATLALLIIVLAIAAATVLLAG